MKADSFYVRLGVEVRVTGGGTVEPGDDEGSGGGPGLGRCLPRPLTGSTNRKGSGGARRPPAPLQHSFTPPSSSPSPSPSSPSFIVVHTRRRVLATTHSDHSTPPTIGLPPTSSTSDAHHPSSPDLDQHSIADHRFAEREAKA